MAGDKIAPYLNAAGETLDTATSDGVRRALADLSKRISDLENRAPVSAVMDETDAARINRIESVVGTYFRDELRDFDAARSGEPAKG